MATTTKGTQQKRRSKGDGSIFKNKRGGWTARYRKKGLPDKEFSAPTKGEAKKLLDEWKVKIAIQDAITSNIKVCDYAQKYLYRKSLYVEAGIFKQSSLDRLERTYNTHIRDTEAARLSFNNLTADDITQTVNANKDTLSYSSIKKIYLFWSAMIKHAKNMGELPNNYSIMNSVIMPAENSLPVETKEIEIIDEKTIDRVNILNATKIGMENAANLIGITPDIVLIDAVKGLDLKYNSCSIIKADAKSYAVACASILAKVTRDRIMRKYDEIYPQYGFIKHKYMCIIIQYDTTANKKMQ